MPTLPFCPQRPAAPRGQRRLKSLYVKALGEQTPWSLGNCALQRTTPGARCGLIERHVGRFRAASLPAARTGRPAGRRAATRGRADASHLRRTWAWAGRRVSARRAGQNQPRNDRGERQVLELRACAAAAGRHTTEHPSPEPTTDPFALRTQLPSSQESNGTTVWCTWRPAQAARSRCRRRGLHTGWPCRGSATAHRAVPEERGRGGCVRICGEIPEPQRMSWKSASRSRTLTSDGQKIGGNFLTCQGRIETTPCPGVCCRIN